VRILIESGHLPKDFDYDFLTSPIEACVITEQIQNIIIDFLKSKLKEEQIAPTPASQID